MAKAVNKVILQGKVSRVSGLKYTPSGYPILGFTLSVLQKYFEKNSMGVFEVELGGRSAEDINSWIKVGREMTVYGSLYGRSYRNRSGEKVFEVKVIARRIGGAKNEKK